MSNFSKKYSLPHHPESIVFLTWETGYKNMKIYHNGSVAGLVNSLRELMNGVEFQLENDERLEVKMSTSKPMMPVVKIDGNQYYTDNKLSEKESVTSLASLFWTLAGLAVIGAVIAQGMMGFQLSHPVAITQLIMDIVVISIYTLSAIYLGKNKSWAYFLGTGTFFLMTLLVLYTQYVLTGFGFSQVIAIVIRISILVFLFTYIKRAIYIMRKPENELAMDILDA